MDFIKHQSLLENQSTPFYVYDLQALGANLNACKQEANKYGYEVHYALKANANNKILSAFVEKGFGADCVSGGEVQAAVQAGFNPQKIVFAGVGKADWEIELGLSNEIACFNVESVQEIEVINGLAQKMGKVAPIALRLNPNVDPKTHSYITTGLEENKFGINPWEYENVIETAKNSKNIKIKGLHFHIGSQITDLGVFKNLCSRVNEIQNYFVDRGFSFEDVNLGGGLGIDYAQPDENPIPDYKAFFKIFDQFLEPLPNQKVHFELGRSLVAYCGNLITKVLYIKEGVKTNFAIIDAGMTELIRPALYNACHKVENIFAQPEDFEKYDVVGPICESSDTFVKAIELPKTKRGDFIAIRCAGAYGEVMASGYNLRKLPKSIFI